jgi:hypothetical protein
MRGMQSQVSATNGVIGQHKPSCRTTSIITPTTIPIEVYIQEAENLYKWCQADKETLTKASLDWKLVEDIPIRAGALREAVSRWVAQRFTKQETGKLWTQKSNELFQMRNTLLHEFRFAYRNNTYVMGRIATIAGSQAYAALIQDLNDLSVLGKNNPDELKAINFDMTTLDKAAQLAKEIADLLASTTLEADYSSAKKIRDQAFTLLKNAVDEICNFGQYVFWKNDSRRRGYSSSYLRRVRKKRSKDDTKTENSHTSPSATQ